MISPPRTADGATVMFYAVLSGLPITRIVRHFLGDTEQCDFAGLLIATYGHDDFYLFYCDDQWQVLNDTLHYTLDDARQSAEAQYPGITARWQPVTV